MSPCLPMLYVVLPTIGWSWPVLAPLVASTAAMMGYRSVTKGLAKTWLSGRVTRQMENMRRVTISMDEVLTEVIAEELGAEERIAFEREDLLLVFRKDGRGKFFIDVSGPRAASELSMRLRGEEFARELVKKFAYHKMVEQIQKRGATIVEEEVKANGDVVLKSRQWR